MLRPEAWFLAAMYFVWVAWKATWRQRFLFAALAASGPLTWAAVDLLVTGNPPFSQHYTAARPRISAASARSRSCRRPIPVFFENLVKLPVLARRASASCSAIVLSPRRMVMPLVLLLAGVATFIAIGVAGASVIERYLAVPALALMVLAAVAIGGWTMLLPSWIRTAWMVGAIAIVVLGVAFTATHLNLSRFDNELRFRGQAHDDLTEVLNDPQVQAGLRCGPLTGPNHKIVPDARWIAGLGDGDVRARAESYRDDRDVPLRPRAWRSSSPAASRSSSTPGPTPPTTRASRSPRRASNGSRPTRFYAAYVRC